MNSHASPLVEQVIGVTSASLTLSVEAILAANDSLTASALERARRVCLETDESLVLVLSRLGLVGEEALANQLAEQLGLDRVTASSLPTAPVADEVLNPEFLKETHCLPLAMDANALSLAMVDPTDQSCIAALEFALGQSVRRFVATPSIIEAALRQLYPDRDPQAPVHYADDGWDADDSERMRDMASDAPVIRLVNRIINEAVETMASDIHLEPDETGLRVRFRIDGVLRDHEPPPSALQQAILSRIKIMAKLNIAERRLAQDGRINLAIKGKDVDFRVSTTPTLHGESVVLRILNRDAVVLDLPSLGFDGALHQRLQDSLRQPHGIVLVTGPTGSGKTTSLYAGLLTLNSSERKILTVEDPIEYHIAGINQVQVKPKIGLTFANALRSFLRQDPDIMMVGEIRDLETAQIAVQAALTGHLILSTLHTNDATGAVTRLLDMGVEDYLITSTVNGILAQRLVRTLCPNCREPYDLLPDMAEKLAFGAGPLRLFRPIGCHQCGGSGYNGRTIIGEMLLMSDRIRHLVMQKAEARLIQQAALDEGMRPMVQHGLQKALAGITSIEEVLRVTKSS